MIDIKLIREKDKKLKGQMVTQGTPVVLVHGYFDNLADK